MTAYEEHGRLHVEGTQLTGEKGEPVQLKGPSTLGVVWYPQYINREAFETIRGWGANLIRLAMYTMEEDGYLSGGDQDYIKDLIDKGVRFASELGMYVIIDWHILSDGNPHTHKEEAKLFFEEMTGKYASYGNVLYEICNEPNGEGVDWPLVKSYAEEIIPVIRRNAPDAVILVGTPTWSQDVDAAAEDPLVPADNLMYSLHYYAATHKQGLRDKLMYAHKKGLPIFVDEYSISDASGNGLLDYEEARAWSALTDELNLSFAQWSLSNRDETSAMIKKDCTKICGWGDEDLTETGLWMKKRLTAR